MKKIVVALLLLIPFYTFSQIPDSLDVDLPWEVIYFPDCDATMGEGPISNSLDVYVYLEKDTTFGNDYFDCLKRIKEWKILHWESAQVYDFIQIGSYRDFANTVCEQEVYLHYEDFPIDLTPEDLLVEITDGHEYAFSNSDPSFNSISIDELSENNFELYVYDFTDTTVCKSDVFVTYCEDDVVFSFPEMVDIEFNGEPYIEITLDQLNADIQYPCGTYSSKITLGSSGQNLLYAHSVGSVVPVRVELNLSTGEKYVKTIKLNVIGNGPPPIPMFIEEKSFESGETIELDIWSDEILGLVAWQLQLEFENVELIEITPGDMFEYTPNNIIDENTLRALWFPADGLSMDVDSDDSWFTITLQPQFSGTTYDIFKTGQDPWSSIAIDDDDFIFEYEADFIFNVAPRDLLNIENEIEEFELSIFPNPVADVLTLSGELMGKNGSKVEFYDISGALIQNGIQQLNVDYTYDISNLSRGMYLVKVQNGNAVQTKKFLKM